MGAASSKQRLFNRAERARDLSEAGNHFDFSPYYQKAEFCDRVFKLETVRESAGLSSAQASSTSFDRVLHFLGAASSIEGQPRSVPSSLDTGMVPSAPSSDAGSDFETEEIPVSAIVVAAKSRVLEAMLFNGMKESDKTKPVTVRFTASEKDAFKEMLRFIYTGRLSPRLHSTAAHMRELVSLLLVSDKFEVPSFTGAVLKCITERQWKNSDAVTLAESIPEILTEQLPEVKALVVKARAYVIDTFKDVSATWTSAEFLELNWGQIELLLQSDNLEAEHEEVVLEKLLVWIGAHFPDLDERRRAIARLAPHLRQRCFGGEFLNSALFRLPELDLIRNDIRMSLDRLDSTGEVAQSFADRRRSRLVIVDSFRLDSDETKLKSKSARWLGQRWHFESHKEVRKSPPTVGIFLYIGALATELEATVELRLEYFVRRWPERTWKQIHGSTVKAGAFFAQNYSFGFMDALGMPWDQAMQAMEYFDPSGRVWFRIEAGQVRKTT